MVARWHFATIPSRTRWQTQRDRRTTGVTTDVCLIFPSITAVQDGFNVLAVLNASGSSYEVQEDLARNRMEHAGVVLTTTNTVITLVQDWSTPQG
jgi:hypothetical protein